MGGDFGKFLPHRVCRLAIERRGLGCLRADQRRFCTFRLAYDRPFVSVFPAFDDLTLKRLPASKPAERTHTAPTAGTAGRQTNMSALSQIDMCEDRADTRASILESLLKRRQHLGLLGLLCTIAVVGQAWADPPAPPDSRDMAAGHGFEVTAVIEIFEAKCYLCHNPGSPRRSAVKRWADGRDLAQLASRYVESDLRTTDQYQRTSLWQILTADPDQRMPPKGSPGGQLTSGELATIQRWIASGAPSEPLSDVAGSISPSNSPHADTADTDDLGFVRRLQRWLGKFHPAVVHLPIGLLLAAALAELLWWLTGRVSFDFACRFCTVVGALGAIPAVMSGLMAGSFESGLDDTFAFHRLSGILVAVVAVASAILSITAAGRAEGQPIARSRAAMRWLVFINAVLVSIAGHLGGELVHGHDYFAW